MKLGRLILIPSWLAETNTSAHFPLTTLNEVNQLSHFVVERAKSARHFLKTIGFPHHFDNVEMVELNKHIADDPKTLLSPCLNGHDLGLISEAGVPAVADPGGALVAAAHGLGIEVVPLIGPSSLLLALMASGMNGQRFTFHGYLPKDDHALAAYLREMEGESRAKQTTHFFIETPYRNQKLLSVMLNILQPQTRLTMASDLTAPSQLIKQKTVAEWRSQTIVLDKRPTVFLLFAGNFPS